MTRFLATVLVVVVIGMPVIAGSEQERLDRLIVYGDGFAFGVKEPAGWSGDTENAAKVHANIVFYRSSETLERAAVVIRVRVGKKTDENTAEDLAYDMKGYKAKFPAVQFIDLDIPHPLYPVFAKVVSVPQKFYEYVAYVNPGKGVPKLLSVSMSKSKQPASEEEVATFREVVASLVMLSGKEFKVIEE